MKSKICEKVAENRLLFGNKSYQTHGLFWVGVKLVSKPRAENPEKPVKCGFKSSMADIA